MTVIDRQLGNEEYRGRAEAKLVRDATNGPLSVGDVAIFKKRRPKSRFTIEKARVIWMENEDSIELAEMIVMFRAMNRLIENDLSRQIQEIHEKVVNIEEIVALVNEKMDRFEAMNQANYAELIRIILSMKEGEVS